MTTGTLRTYYVLLVLEIGSRRIQFWNASESPDGAWVVQQFRNLSVVNGQPPDYLIRDRDDKFIPRRRCCGWTPGMNSGTLRV